MPTAALATLPIRTLGSQGLEVGWSLHFLVSSVRCRLHSHCATFKSRLAGNPATTRLFLRSSISGAYAPLATK